MCPKKKKRHDGDCKFVMRLKTIRQNGPINDTVVRRRKQKVEKNNYYFVNLNAIKNEFNGCEINFREGRMKVAT